MLAISIYSGGLGRLVSGSDIYGELSRRNRNKSDKEFGQQAWRAEESRMREGPVGG